MNLRSRRVVSWLLRLGLSIALLGALASAVGWKSIGHQLAQADLGLVVLAWCTGLFAHLVSAFQMQLIMRGAGLQVSLSRIYLANAQSVFYGFLMPGDLMSAAAKWANLAAATGEKTSVITAIAYNRIMILAPWVVAGTVALSLTNPWNSAFLTIIGFSIAILMLTTFVLLFLPRPGAVLDRMVLELGRRILPQRMNRSMGTLVDSLAAFRRFGLKQHLWILSASTAAAGIGMLRFGLFAAAIGIVLPLLTLVWARSALVLIRQLPISIHGVGVQETGLVLMLGAYGVSADAAIGLGLLMFTNVIVFALIGGVYQGALLLGWARWSINSEGSDGESPNSGQR